MAKMELFGSKWVRVPPNHSMRKFHVKVNKIHGEVLFRDLYIISLSVELVMSGIDTGQIYACLINSVHHLTRYP